MPPRKVKSASEGIAPETVSEAPKGRPSVYTEALAAEICQRVADGETLTQVCRSEHIPPRTTIMGWILDDRSGFSVRYARAKDMQIEYWADELLDVSDDGSNDWMERRNGEGDVSGWQVNGEHIARSRLRVDSRKWLLSKLKPKLYGEGTQRVEVGKPGEFAELEDLSDADLADIARGSGGRAPASTNGAARSSSVH